MDRGYPIITVNAKAERAIRAGHPWVYGAEVTGTQGTYINGDIVDVCSAKGSWLGAGFVNDVSKIRVRIISRNTNDRFDEAFWRRRISYALEYRKTVLPQEAADACRLIFGEADGFPGLTVDRYGKTLVSEVLCCGMDRIKGQLYDMLLEQTGAEAVYERSDSPLREKEGLERFSGWAKGTGDGHGHNVIRVNGLAFDVDCVDGQKTGFFLDQRDNRAAVARISAGKRVLDCFTHVGGFALHAAKGGAAQVTAVDISQSALDSAAVNASLNNLKVNFVQADVFAFLTELAEKKSRDYDLIILDPPAFTKSGATLKAAYRGYKEINLKAMKLLPRGGYLATCSCSHFMTDELFRQMLTEAATDAEVRLRQVYVGRQAADHPILWGVPETDYLEFYIFQVV